MHVESSVTTRLSYLGGVEKAHVREHCWLPLLRERKEKAGGRIKYLTLPGRQLTEIRDLVEGGVVEGPEDLILLEREIMDYYIIVRDAPLLNYKYRVEPSVVIHGDINT